MSDVKEDLIVMRIVKAYLLLEGETKTSSLAQHIKDGNYGLRQSYTTRTLGQKLKGWSVHGRSASWFNVRYKKVKKERVWFLDE